LDVEEAPQSPRWQWKRFLGLTLLRRGFAINPMMTLIGLLFVATLIATLAGLIIDHREIAGAPAWLKPTKFAISLSVYCFTFVWLLSFLQRWKRTVRVISVITGLCLAIEMVLLVVQVVRGTTSHFNHTTPVDSAVFSAMGMIVMIVWSAGFLTAVLLLITRMANPVLAWSLRLGLLISLVGMLVGFLMTMPTPQQQAAMSAGQHVSIIGAPSVGVPDGGPGLPVVGWSTIGGDLRIPHFVGLHALQMLPLIGWLLSVPHFRRLRTRHRVALVWTMSLSYLGLVGVLVWQALRGQSLIAPDGLTWLAEGMLCGVALAITGAILLHARRSAVQAA